MGQPIEQDEWTTLEAQLREALQHQRAAYERMVERQREVEALMERARALLGRGAAGPRGLTSPGRSADTRDRSAPRPGG